MKITMNKTVRISPV